MAARAVTKVARCSSQSRPIGASGFRHRLETDLEIQTRISAHADVAYSVLNWHKTGSLAMTIWRADAASSSWRALDSALVSSWPRCPYSSRPIELFQSSDGTDSHCLPVQSLCWKFSSGERPERWERKRQVAEEPSATHHPSLAK